MVCSWGSRSSSFAASLLSGLPGSTPALAERVARLQIGPRFARLSATRVFRDEVPETGPLLPRVVRFNDAKDTPATLFQKQDDVSAADAVHLHAGTRSHPDLAVPLERYRAGERCKIAAPQRLEHLALESVAI